MRRNPSFQANRTPNTTVDPDLDARFRALEAHAVDLGRFLSVLIGQVTPAAPPVVEAAGSSEGGGDSGGGSRVDPGTIDGQVLRWNDANQVWEPADNVLIDASGDVTIEATLLITSQANANAFAAREQSGGQSQPVAVFQTQSGFSAVRFTPSSALARVLPESVGGGVWGSDGFQGTPTFQGRRAQGTASSPSAALSGNVLVSLQGLAFTSSGYEATPPGLLEFTATENHTPTNRGTRAYVKTTPNASATASEALGVEQNGDVTTPGKLRTTGGLGVGNSAAASTPGAVVAKMEVFDAAGTSLGFVAIFDSIS